MDLNKNNRLDIETGLSNGQHQESSNSKTDTEGTAGIASIKLSDSQEQPSDWRRVRGRYSDREVYIRDLYIAGYDQGPSAPRDLNHVVGSHVMLNSKSLPFWQQPFSGWSSRPPAESDEKISDLRLFTAICILFSPVFGIGALVQASRAQDEAKKGNITRAKELNSTALGLAIAGIAISILLGVAMGVQQFLLYKK